MVLRSFADFKIADRQNIDIQIVDITFLLALT
jgi:hypothetical protein